MQTKIAAEGFRLSPQQRRLWSLLSRGRQEPYRVVCAALVEGPLDAAALKSALEEAAARHEILRTTFRHLPGMSVPVQVIGERGVEWGPRVDLSSAPEGERSAAFEELFETMKGLPFSLERGPLVRAALLRLAPRRKILLLGLSALCADAAGVKNLIYEVTRAAAARAAGPQNADGTQADDGPQAEAAGQASHVEQAGGVEPSDDGEPLQYADISEYLSQLLEEEGAGAEYWGGYDLAELSARRTHLQRRPPDAEGFDPQPSAVPLGPDFAARVERAARACGSTPELFLLACWHALLHRVTGWREVAVGVAFDGRRLEGLGELPGAFVKYLPVEARLDADTTFARLLAQLGERSAVHAEWQDIFNWEELAGTSEDDPAPYLPLCFDYEDLGPARAAGRASVSLLALYSCSERFDLKLSCARRGDELRAELHFDARQFDRRDVECLAREFAALAECAAADTGAAVADLEMSDADARRRLLEEFNRTGVDYAGARHVHRLVEEHARQTPEALAVVAGGDGGADAALSYRELNARANRLAHYLAGRGVGPDVLVGVCLGRSAEMVVALLGVLKAGGAYLPLDPAYPRERLAFVVEDARPKLILTERRHAGRLRPGVGATVVLLDETHDELGRQSEENPAREADDASLAYVIYTSGSTGRPKGVMVSRAGLLNYVTWSAAAYRAAEGRGAPVHSSLAFDLTVTSLFPPLAAGRPLRLLEDEEAAGEQLAAALRARPDFSLVKLTPAHLELLGLLLRPDEVAGAARALVVGGEALHAESLSFWRAHAPETRIVNEYGPTETVVGCCVYEVEAGARLSGPVPIGRPIANTQIYVLDERLRPAPFFAAGEIYIGGAGVARGYLNRPDVTAARFVPDPFSAAPGARLYRTGDLGRRRADGTLEFLGRNDHQVKIKGYRIELGEVEAALRELPEVREAAAAAREESGERRLVAYVALREGAAAGGVELQRRLQEKLPDYMIPSAFAFLERLPLTPNGKVDRDALPAPDPVRPDLDKSYAPPRTPAEKMLADLWARALGLERVGINDNFFELGGDSILSIQIANRAAAAGLRLTPRQIFQNRTIAELAAVAEPAAEKGADADGGVEGAEAGPVPLTPIQHWFFEQNLAEPHHWNQSLLLEVRRALEPTVVERALRRLIAHHDALRLRFVRGPSGWRQHRLPPGEGDAGLLACESLAAVPEAEQEAALGELAASFQKTLNLAEGPVFRAALVDLGPGRPQRLLLAAHHLCVDIVSWGVLLDGLRAACEQEARGREAQLAPRTTSFGAWAGRLADYAKSERLRGELSYWAADERRWAPKLPVDYAAGANTEGSARTVWATLDEERTRSLIQEVPKVYRTMINDVLLTALVQSFAAWTRSRSLLVDLENHGREDILDDVDLSRTVGWFTCIFPALLDLGDTARVGEALKAIKEQVRRVPAGGIGYGLLRYLSGDADAAARLAALPPAEVCFNYVGRGGGAVSEPGLFATARGEVGPTKSPLAARRYLIEVNGGITGGQLRTAWTYSENLHARATVENFAAGFVRALGEIIDHCLSPEAGGYTPSDFSLPDLSQKELDRLIADMGKYDE